MTSVFTQTLNLNSTSNANYSFRCPCKVVNGAGSSVTVTFAATSTASFKLDNASIGIQDSGPNVKATPVELKFGGASGFTISAGQSITSDAASLTVAMGDSIMVIMDVASTNGTCRYAAAGQNASRWYRANDNSYNVTAPGVNYSHDFFPWVVTSIDIAGAINDDVLWSQGLTAQDTGYGGYSFRIISAAMSRGGTQLRVACSAGATAALDVNHASIGILSSGYNTTATPVELKFGGSSGFSIARDVTILSDLLDFNWLSSDQLVVILDVGTNGNLAGPVASIGNRAWKAATASYNVASPTGFSVDTYGSAVMGIRSLPFHAGGIKNNRIVGAGVF